MAKIIVALGSNHNQEENIKKAMLRLSAAFDGQIRFTDSLWTKPIGMVSDMFLNCLGFAETDMTQNEVTALLKQTERLCGNTEALRRENIIEMDIDLLMFGDVKLKPSDWQREYVKALLNNA